MESLMSRWRVEGRARVVSTAFIAVITASACHGKGSAKNGDRDARNAPTRTIAPSPAAEDILSALRQHETSSLPAGLAQ
jgi:hypothetical protein